MEVKKQLSVANTINKTLQFTFTFKYTREYVKRDFKYLVIVFIASFILIFGLFDLGALILNHLIKLIDIDITDFEDPILSGILFAKIFGVLFSDIVLTLIFFSLCFIIIYSFSWITVSKSLYVLKHDYSNIEYRSLLQDSYENRFKSFFGFSFSLTLAIVSFFIILLIIQYVFLFFHVLNSSNQIISLISVFLIIIITFLLIGFYVLPTQLYPSILRAENSFNYFKALQGSYKIFPSWKIKLKFMTLIGSIIVIAYFLFGSLIILVSLFFSFIGLINLDELILFLLLFSLLTTCYFVFLFELGSIVLGNLYGQVYSMLIS